MVQQSFPQKNILAIEIKKIEVIINKPVFLVLSILLIILS